MGSKGSPSRPLVGRISFASLMVLAGLLVVPSMAFAHWARRLDPLLMAGHVVVISVLTFWLYRRDKRKAESGEWRTPESVLHLAEILGGWPAAFLAQRAFRHKISKTSYQAMFWLIVILHQAAALDSLNGWKISQAIIRLLQR